MKIRKKIGTEKRYVYSKSLSHHDIRVIFIWYAKGYVIEGEGLIVVEFDGNLIEPFFYKPDSYISCAKKFLEIVKVIDRINDIDELKKFLNSLEKTPQEQ